MRFIVLLTAIGLFPFISVGQPCTGNSNTLPTPSKCFEIVSILVDACDGSNEGQNEMVRLKIGASPLLISGFSIPAYASGNVNWGSGSGNPWRNFCDFNTSTLNKISQINSSISSSGKCGILIPLNNNQSVPAGAGLLIITSESFNPTAQSFTNLMDTLYVVLQCSGNTAGHFVNYGSSATRRLILNHSSCSDTVIYDRNDLIKQDQTQGAEDGATVNFAFNGTPTYVNYGCAVPVIPVTFDAGTVNPGYCSGSVVNLNASVTGTTCYVWQAKDTTQGTFSDTLITNPTFTLKPSATGQVTLYFRIRNSCQNAKDSVVFSILSPSGNLEAGNDTTICSGRSLPLKGTSAASGAVTWSTTGTGSFSNSGNLVSQYTPGTGEVGTIRIRLSQNTSCGVLKDSFSLTFANSVNPTFTTSRSAVCLNSDTITLTPVNTGGVFTGQHLYNGNKFIPMAVGNFKITYTTGATGCPDSSSQTVQVVSKPDPTFSISANTACQGDPDIQLTPATGGGLFSGATQISGNLFHTTDTGNFTIQYLVTNGTCNDSSTKLIRINPLPDAAFNPNLTQVCEGTQPIALNPAEPTAVFTGSIYLTGNTFNPAKAGTYSITCQVTKNGCTATSAKTLTIDTLPDPDFTLTDTLFCEGDEAIALQPLTPGGVFYGTGVSGNQFTPDQPGIFTLYYEAVKGNCKDTSFQKVRVIEKPDASISYLPLKPVTGQSVQFSNNSISPGTPQWIFETPAIVTSGLQNPVITYPNSGTFNAALILDNEGCRDTDLVVIVVIGDDTLFIPNVFTPNGDALNETFLVFTTSFSTYLLEIYNRWGEKMFTSKSPEYSWDGTYHSGICPDGVYFYILEVKTVTGKERKLNGTVTLLR